MDEKNIFSSKTIIKALLKEIISKIANRSKKGGFKKDGSTHYSGIMNEQKIVLWLNQDESIIGNYLRPSKEYIIQHKGGTQTKADAVVINTNNKTIFTTLSIKNHKTGTFDWLNSTKGFPEDWSTILKEKIKEIKVNFQIHKNIDSSREEIECLFSSALSEWKMNHSFIQSILFSIYEKYTDGILVHVEKEHLLVYFEKKELLEFQELESIYSYYLKHKEGSCSASIMKINNNTMEEINTNLRIRLVLNNGINALVGTSLRNKISVPCIKIQQDNVDNLLNVKIVNKMVEKYNC